jgi:diadenylate cyclase
MDHLFTLFRIGFLSISVLDIIDILAVAFIFYKLYLLMRRTRAVQMFIGLIFIFAVSFLAQSLNMQELSWIFRNLSTVWLVAFIIIFQPELRRILTIMGQNRLVRLIARSQTSQVAEEIAKASFELSRRGYGALIVLVRDTGLRMIIETGVRIQALVNASLIVSVFNPRSPLHDGAIVIENDVIEAAKCILPLSRNPRSEELWGTRHRAAMGMAEESDATVVAISEETGSITVFENEEMRKVENHESLVQCLTSGLGSRKEKSDGGIAHAT